MIEQEVLLTKEKLKELYHGQKIMPKLNVILVTKKISDKFV